MFAGVLAAVAASYGQVPVLNPGNGHSYIAVAEVRSWQQAKSAAEALGGHLATVTSADEQAFIAAKFPDACNRGFWLGGLQAPGQAQPFEGWSWVTGEPWSYTGWLPGVEPNDSGGTDERFLALHGYLGTNLNGYWNDVQPFNAPGYVVEFSEVTTPEDNEFSLRIPVPAGWTLMTATAANLALVPEVMVSAGSTGEALITATPKANQSGPTTIMLTFRQPSGAISTRSFSLQVAPVNDPPHISPIGDVNTNEDTPPPPVVLHLRDEEDPPGALTITGSSSDPGLFPSGSLLLGGAGTGPTLTLVPAINQSGKATITVKVTDSNGASGSTDFVVTVNPINDQPTITLPPDLALDEDTVSGNIPVRVDDPETPPSDLILTAESSNPGLISPSEIVFVGSGTDRSIRFTPRPNQNGTANITVSVTDGNGTDNNAKIRLTVKEVNDPPLIVMPPSVTGEVGKELVIPFTLEDVETPPEQLTVTAESSDPAVLPLENIKYLVPGPSEPTKWQLTITPAQPGPTIITLQASDPDGGGNRGQTFLEVLELPMVWIEDALRMERDLLGFGFPTMAFHVGLAKPVRHDVRVTVTTGPFSGDSATADIDYKTTTKEVVIPAGSTIEAFTVEIQSDDIPEGVPGVLTTWVHKYSSNYEDFQVRIIAVDGAFVKAAPGLNFLGHAYEAGVATGYILDNDWGGPGLSVEDLPEVDFHEDTFSPPISIPNIADALGIWPGTLDLKITVSDPALVGEQGINREGSVEDPVIILEPSPDRSGEAALDLEWSLGGEVLVTGQYRFSVIGVNDPPRFTLSFKAILGEVGIERRVEEFVNSVSPGPPDESGQSVTFVVVADRPDLFSRGPAISPEGTLTYTLALGASGFTTVSVTAMDDGGTAHGGKDTSQPEVFSIYVAEKGGWPPMRMEKLPEGKILIRWKDPGNIYGLETTHSLGPPSWGLVPQAEVVREGEENRVLIPGNQPESYARLRLIPGIPVEQ